MEIKCSLCKKVANKKRSSNFYVSTSMFVLDTKGTYELSDYDNSDSISDSDIVTCERCEQKISDFRETITKRQDKP